MTVERALALSWYMMVLLQTLCYSKAKEGPSNISRAYYLNQLGWDFLKWQMISVIYDFEVI